MNKPERIKAALNGQDVDRIPVSVWMHYSDVDQDPRSLAETQVAFVKKYDYDFIKLMPFGTYTIQDWGAKIKIYCDKFKEPIVEAPGINDISDWEKLAELPAIYGTWGKQLQLAQYVSKMVGGDIPYIQTIFSPLTIAKKLAGDRIFTDIKENPGVVHGALEVITRTCINFIRANMEAGVSGFFFATQNASYDVNDEALFDAFATPYDLRLFDAFKDETWFNVIHIHGDNIMFDKVSQYPGNCLNWHDRHTDPDFKTARETCGKCFLGGIQEVPYFVGNVLKYNSIMATSTPDQIEKHIHEAIDQVKGQSLIVGPGCVTDPKTSDENLSAVRRAVETYAK